MSRLASALLAVALTAACDRPKPPANPVQLGDALFARTCASCHGREGRGGIAQSDGGGGPRNFTDRAFQQSRTDAELRQAIVNGKGAMPAFGDFFSEDELRALILRVRRFGPDRG